MAPSPRCTRNWRTGPAHSTDPGGEALTPARIRGLAERLGERRTEIEGATVTRVHAISDPGEVDDPEYAPGLKESVSVGIDYAIAAIEGGPEAAPIPERLIHQARAAARNGVSLDTVLRRYSAGYALLGDFLIAEAGEGRERADELKLALRQQAAVYDRLVTAISEAHAEETARRMKSNGRRRAERVRMLLAGEPVDPGELCYELDTWHLAMVAAGPGAPEGLRDLAAMLSRSLLLVHGEEQAVWAWLGGASRLSPADPLQLARRALPPDVSLGLGEPGRGLEGWRLTHRQARAAMSVAQRGPERLTRYGGVALVACALRDDLLATSLREIYLSPLERERNGGALLHKTLGAYFTTGRNVSSAAAALGVSRQTVRVRLRSVEERIGRSIEDCAADLETAVRLRDLTSEASALGSPT